MIRGVNGLLAYARASGTTAVDGGLPAGVTTPTNDAPDFSATLTQALGAVESQHATAGGLARYYFRRRRE